MVKVGLDGVAEVQLGSTKVSRLMLAAEQVWPAEDAPRLDLSPDTIWLLRAKDWTEYVQILSNVKWNTV